jgi:hypothetical protein
MIVYGNAGSKVVVLDAADICIAQGRPLIVCAARELPKVNEGARLLRMNDTGGLGEVLAFESQVCLMVK